MEWKTRISKITEDDMVIRGEKHSSLIRESSFSDAIFLLLSGRKPKKAESRIFEAMLVSVIDHGIGTASSMAARITMSSGNSLNTAVGAGVLALGDYHGGAIESAMKQLQEITDVGQFVKEHLKEKKVIFGYGHKVFKDSDPRVKEILSLCKELSYHSKHIDHALQVEKEILRQKGKKIPLNIDGLIAAILLEMGFSPELGKGFFIIARTPGLVAQAMEEKQYEKPVRRVPEEEIEFVDGKD